MKRTRQYPNKAVRASRLFRADVRRRQRRRTDWSFSHRMVVLANNPDTEVSEIHPPSVGLLGDVNAQFARLDRAIAGLK